MAWGYGTASDLTVRDLTTVGVGGTAIRVRISNVTDSATGNGPSGLSRLRRLQAVRGQPRNHKMMLDHYQQTKNLLVSYSPKALGFF
jgi:hypothetical protein